MSWAAPIPARRHLRVRLLGRPLVVASTLALAASLLASPAAAARAQFVVAPGWPRPAVHGDVIPGAGDAVTVTDGENVVAFTMDGRRRWTAGRNPQCGNCEPVIPALRADGSIGPIGFDASPWAVDRRGRLVEACLGVVRADGTCISVAYRRVDEQTVPESLGFHTESGLRATRNGTILWEYFEPDFLSFLPSVGIDTVTTDGAGNVYAGFPAGVDRTGAAVRSRLISVTPGGAFRWRREGSGGFPAAGSPGGVLT
ncbi:MAG: hypothetical protein KDC36_06150, partial [Thermoleophilia bacterium]|nr:hypothetical protein [Thermoleophilia bacterium]